MFVVPWHDRRWNKAGLVLLVCGVVGVLYSARAQRPTDIVDLLELESKKTAADYWGIKKGPRDGK